MQSNSFFFLTLKQLDARGTKYLEISIVVKKKELMLRAFLFFNRRTLLSFNLFHN